jgi:hypothetical protein
MRDFLPVLRRSIVGLFAALGLVGTLPLFEAGKPAVGLSPVTIYIGAGSGGDAVGGGGGGGYRKITNLAMTVYYTQF